LKNFGFVNETNVSDAGINGKMSEIQAAIGLLQLDSFQKNVLHRGSVYRFYRESLEDIEGIGFFEEPKLERYNYSYMPIQINEDCGVTRDCLYERLKEYSIYTRRYFYPLITEFSMYRSLASARCENLPKAKRLSDRVLCLPMSGSLSRHDQERIVDAVRTICV